MNIKYTFRSEQSVSEPLLKPTIFDTNQGGLYPGRNREAFVRNMQLIEQRIDAIQKELSYWDLYKVTSKVEDPAELDAIFSDLITGQSLVIACESFTSNSGDVLHRGDVIIKLASGNAALIQAVNSGYYKPEVSIDEQTGMLKIDYKYKEGQPEETSFSEEVALASSTNSFVYGIYQNVGENNIVFDVCKYYPDPSATTNFIEIRPLIKFFNKTDDQEGNWLEEIIWDYNITKENDQWKIDVTGKPSILNFIQVK